MPPVRVVLVRHGKPSAGYLDDVDPGLDSDGLAQATSAADALAVAEPRVIVSSPMRRARDTAVVIAQQLRAPMRVDPRVSEIPAPGDEVADRGAWLRALLDARWPTLDAPLRRWRDGVLDAIREADHGTVIVTHYLAINVAVGAATGHDRVRVCRPVHCSRTVLDIVDGRLELVELGAQRSTKIG